MKLMASATLPLIATLLSLPGAAQSGPQPLAQRIIVHAVDCSIAAGRVCSDDRAVFDEAVASITDDRPIEVQTQLASGNQLPSLSAAAVRAYLIADGIAADQVIGNICSDAPSSPAPTDSTLGSGRIELQLAELVEE